MMDMQDIEDPHCAFFNSISKETRIKLTHHYFTGAPGIDFKATKVLTHHVLI